jgi:hypothetical protein
MLPLWLPQGAPAAIGVIYVASDVPDEGAGDRWRYDYVASGTAFAPGDLLEVRFEFGRYEQIEVLDAPDDWLAAAFEPDLIFGDGSFAAQYGGSGSSASQTFAVTFVWQESGIPGPQQFLLYDAGGTAIAAGATLPVPEPPPAFLLIAGLVLAGFVGRRRLAWLPAG